MGIGVYFAIGIAVAFVAVALYLIDRWGPRSARRSLYCPEKNVPAQIDVTRREGSFGALLEPDITACSLIPGGEVDCAKGCLR